MVHFTSASSFVALAVLTLLGSSVTSVKARNVDKFYITEPACDSQGCTINVKPNSTLHINWLNPINGKIDITLVPEAKQRNARKTAKQLKSVKIAHAVAAHSHDNTCKKYDGAKSCGSFDWHVPADIKAGDYSIDIHSLHQTSVHGYSDIVVIESEKTSKSNGAPAAAAKDTPTKRAADHEEESSAKIPKVVKKHKSNRKHKKGKHHGKEHKKVDDRAEEKGKKHEKAAKSTDKSKTDKKSSKNETDEKSNKKAKTSDDGKAKTDKKHKSKSSSKDDASHKKIKTDKSSKEHKAKGDEKKTSKSA